MFKNRRKRYVDALALLLGFALWTLAVGTVDVRPIGPLGSLVGLAGINGFFRQFTGICWMLYQITDMLSVIPLGFAAGFALLGLLQWIHRKSLLKVDRSIMALGGFYLAVAAAFVLFEVFPVNYRPVLIEGRLEASYPSSTTMLVLCVMPTAAMQLKRRLTDGRIKSIVMWFMAAFTAFMLIGRIFSGVHWITDIIGGALLSAGLVLLYACAAEP